MAKWLSRVAAAEFLRRVRDKLPYKGHTVLTDNGVPFTPQAHQFLPGGHRFYRICREYGVAHRLTKPAHPWTNGPLSAGTARLKKPPSSAYTTKRRRNLMSTYRPFCWPTTTPSGSKLYVASPPTNLSVPSGKRTPLPLPVTRPSSRWDYTHSSEPICFAKPLYDPSNVRQLVRHHEAIVRRLAWAFIEATPVILPALDEALTRAGWEAVGDAAHHLKSSLDGLGVESLRHIIREIERYNGSRPIPAHAAQQVAQVRATTEQVMADLRGEFPDQH